jgi:hypothetical protein
VQSSLTRTALVRLSRSRRLQWLAFALLCLLLAAIAVGSWQARTLLSLRTPNMWGLTAFGWVALDTCLVLLLAPLIYRPHLVLTPMAFGLIFADGLCVLMTASAGRYTAFLSLLALFAASLVTIAVVGRPSPRGRRYWLLAHRGPLAAAIVTMLGTAVIATSLVASHVYEANSSTYGRSPDGRWTLVYIKTGSDTYFPAVAVARDVWGVFKEDMIIAQVGYTRPRTYWLNSHLIMVEGCRKDIYKKRDLTPPA